MAKQTKTESKPTSKAKKSTATTAPKKKGTAKKLVINDLTDDLKAGYCQFGNKQQCE